MLALGRFLRLASAVAVLAMLACPTPAQDASSDQAKALLKEGVAQYKALNFPAAKSILLKVDRASLGEADMRIMDEYLGKVDTAIRRQRSAREAYSSAIKALKSNNLAAAEKGFATAAASEYLDGPTRQDARAQLALVKKRAALVAAATKAEQAKAAAAEVKAAEAKAAAAKAAEAKAAKAKAAEAKAARAKAAQAKVAQAKAAAAKRADMAKTKRMLADLEARKVKVAELIAQGRTALDRSQPEMAVGYFKRAAALDSNSQEAQTLLRQSRKLSATIGDSGAITRLDSRRRIARQAAYVEFDKAMKRSREIISRADSEAEFNAAADAAQVAQNVLEANKNLFADKEYRDKLLEVQEQLRYIDIRRQSWEEVQVAKQLEEMRSAQQQRAAKQQFERQHKIETLKQRTNTLMEEHNYSQAAEELDRILQLDPKETWAAGRKEIVEQFLLTLEERDLDQDQLEQEQRSMNDLRRSEIPWYELLRYPRNWREITKRREPFGAGERRGDSEANRLVRQKLAQRLQKLDFDGIDFKDVVQFLQDVSGANIHIKWGSLEAIGIEKSTTVDVHLTDVTLEKALRVILDDVGGVNPLSFIVDEGVITISTKDDLATRTITQVYDIRDLIIRVPNFTGPRIDLKQAAQGGTAEGGGGGGALFGDEDEREGEGEENIPTKSEIVEDIIQLIADTVDPDSWRTVGRTSGAGDIGSIRHLHGQLVVTQTEENQARVLSLLNQLREAKALQIAIEARFISVNTGFLNSIGIDLDFFFNIGSRLGSTSVVDPWTGATVPTSGGTSGWGTGPPGNNRFTPISALQNSNTFTNMVGVSTPVTGSIGGVLANQALSVAGTFLDDIQVDFLIQATQAHSATRSLTAPRLTLLNGQRAYVSIATQQAYIADLEPVVADNAVSFDPTPAYVPTGSTLDVEATISADKRYVTLTVRPQVATLNGFSLYAITVVETDAEGNPTIGSGFVQLPNVTVQELQTTVSVPDGGTLLLGGQKLAGEIEREMGVPLLSKIPIINRLFTNRGMVRDEETLLILIKPTIIIQREEEERQFP